jgi:DNA-binding response OmpR family regulator
MIALLVADTDLSVRSIEDTIEPYGFDVVRYRSPVKALDNIDELSPDAVFISTGISPPLENNRAVRALGRGERQDGDRPLG